MRVAKTYENWKWSEDKAYVKNNRWYVKATRNCDRCTNGVYVARVENGHIVPHPNAGGVCFACGGSGIISKEVRLYTDQEYERMNKSAETAAQKRAVAREEKMKAEFAAKRKEWLTINGFNENETTYIYFPADSYEIKDTLKEAGFRFNQFLLWHIAEVPEEYKDQVVEVKLADVAEIGAWGTGNYLSTAKSYVEKVLGEARPAEASEWIGEEKEKLVDIPVVLTKKKEMMTRFGYSQLIEFTTKGNIIGVLQWWTAVEVPYEVGTSLLLSGTVKEHTEYKNKKYTRVTRCKLKESEVNSEQ